MMVDILAARARRNREVPPADFDSHGLGGGSVQNEEIDDFSDSDADSCIGSTSSSSECSPVSHGRGQALSAPGRSAPSAPD